MTLTFVKSTRDYKGRWKDFRKSWEARTAGISTRIDKEQYEELRAYAKKERITMTEVIRIFITWGLETGKEPK